MTVNFSDTRQLGDEKRDDDDEVVEEVDDDEEELLEERIKENTSHEVLAPCVHEPDIRFLNLPTNDKSIVSNRALGHWSWVEGWTKSLYQL